MPAQSPMYAGDLMTIRQGDGRSIFASHPPYDPVLTRLNMTDNVTGNVPPIDGFAVATTTDGTRYVADGAAGTITALSTDGWPIGKVFVTEPNDNNNPLIGTDRPRDRCHHAARQPLCRSEGAHLRARDPRPPALAPVGRGRHHPAAADGRRVAATASGANVRPVPVR
jgi:hypothetical protein